MPWLQADQCFIVDAEAQVDRLLGLAVVFMVVEGQAKVV